MRFTNLEDPVIESSIPGIGLQNYEERRRAIHLVGSTPRGNGLEFLLTPIGPGLTNVSSEKISYIRVTPSSVYGKEFNEATLSIVRGRADYIRLTNHENKKEYILRYEPPFPKKIIPSSRFNQIYDLTQNQEAEPKSEESSSSKLYSWLSQEFGESLGQSKKVRRRDLIVRDLFKPFLVAHVDLNLGGLIPGLLRTYSRGVFGSLENFMGNEFSRSGYVSLDDRFEANRKGIHSFLLKLFINSWAVYCINQNTPINDYAALEEFAKNFLQVDMGLSLANGVINSLRYGVFATPGIIGTIRTKDPSSKSNSFTES